MGQLSDFAPTAQLRVSSVPTADLEGNLTWVKEDSTFEAIQTKLVLNRFSQLPVFESKKPLWTKLKGSVSWRSIAQAKIRSPKAKVSDALEKPVIVDLDDDLIDLLPRLLEAEYVYVRQGSHITGVVTLHDAVEILDERARPFLLVSEIEQHLRAIVKAAFPEDEIESMLSSRVQKDPEDRSAAPLQKTIEKTTMWELIELVKCEAAWKCLGLGLEQDPVVESLDAARLARNAVVHHRSGLSMSASELSNLAKALRTFAPIATHRR